MRAIAASLLVAAGALKLGGRRAGPGSCECLRFADVYERGDAECGMGLELLRLAMEPEQLFQPGVDFARECSPSIYRLGDVGSVWGHIQQPGVCNWRELLKVDLQDCGGYENSSFYQHQRHGRCIKASQYASPGHFMHKASWCYVSAQCPDLNGGARINDRVAFKTCIEGEDQFLGDLSPHELCVLQNELKPQGRLLGNCQLAAYKAYDMGPGKWEKELAVNRPRERTTYWKDQAHDTAIVQFGRKVFGIYGDFRNGTDHKCFVGCDNK